MRARAAEGEKAIAAIRDSAAESAATVAKDIAKDIVVRRGTRQNRREVDHRCRHRKDEGIRDEETPRSYGFAARTCDGC